MPGIAYVGPAGSYKTSKMLYDHLENFFKAGRTIVTNVDGIGKAQLLLESKYPESHGEILYKASDTPEEVISWQKFYHAGKELEGYAFFIDEVQVIWPTTLTKKALDDINIGNDQAYFHTFDHFCSYHRHLNIDFIVCTTNKLFIHKTIFLNIQNYYVHQNQNIIGLNKILGKEVIKIKHYAQGERNHSSIETFIITKEFEKVFEYYDSTSAADINFSPFQKIDIPWMIFILLGVFVIFLFFMFYYFYELFSDSSTSPSDAPTFSTPGAVDLLNSPGAVDLLKSPSSNGSNSPSSNGSNSPSSNGSKSSFISATGTSSVNYVPFNHPNAGFLSGFAVVYQLESYSYKIGTVQTVKIKYRMVKDDSTYIDINNYELREIGVKVDYYSRCFSKLSMGVEVLYVGCENEFSGGRKSEVFSGFKPYDSKINSTE